MSELIDALIAEFDDTLFVSKGDDLQRLHQLATLQLLRDAFSRVVADRVVITRSREEVDGLRDIRLEPLTDGQWGSVKDHMEDMGETFDEFISKELEIMDDLGECEDDGQPSDLQENQDFAHDDMPEMPIDSVEE